MQLSEWLRANVDFAFQPVFPAARAVSLLIFIILQEQGKVYYFCRISSFFTKFCFFQPPTDSPFLQAIWARSGPVREEMRLLIGRREGSSRRDTPAALPPPCRLESFLAAPKRPHEMRPPRFCARGRFGRSNRAAFLALRILHQQKKTFLSERPFRWWR